MLTTVGMPLRKPLKEAYAAPTKMMDNVDQEEVDSHDDSNDDDSVEEDEDVEVFNEIIGIK